MTEVETKSKKRSPRGGAPVPGAKPRTPIRDRDDRAQIEHALATGQSVRAIAKNIIDIARISRRNFAPRTSRIF